MDTTTKQNLFVKIEKISQEARKCNLDFSNIKDQESVQEIADFLSISPDEAVLFSCLLEISLNEGVDIEELSRHLKCSVLRCLAFWGIFEELEKKSLVIKKRNSGRRRRFRGSEGKPCFSVPDFVVESLLAGDKSLLAPFKEIKFTSLLQKVNDLLSDRDEGEISTSQVFREIEKILENGAQYEFFKFIQDSITKIDHKCLALQLAYHQLGGNQLVLNHFSHAIYDDIGDRLELKSTILNGKNELVKKNIIEIKQDGFFEEYCLVLSKKVLKKLFVNYPELLPRGNEDDGLIGHLSIKSKELFFPESIKGQIDDLTEVLGRSQFRSFQKTSIRNNLPRGITAIFFGHPGTGKTELAMQIAKATRRDVFMVDLSQLKSKWFGESEKRVKKIFDDYNQMLKDKPHAPILLINEADGMISQRINLGPDSAGPAQTLNTIQNIILQEMENFAGILIATTNLTCNMDKAFERRFLFKVDFPKPDAQVRAMIWKDKLPELTDEKARILGQKFDLTGGQIDNQVRQMLLKRSLNKKVNVFEVLLESSSRENGFSERRVIGFN